MGKGVTLATNHQDGGFEYLFFVYHNIDMDLLLARVRRGMISRFPNRSRAISTSQLNILLRFHLMPINVIISHGPQMMTNLGTGFPLRCFQWLSIPNIATGQSSWR